KRGTDPFCGFSFRGRPAEGGSPAKTDVCETVVLSSGESATSLFFHANSEKITQELGPVPRYNRSHAQPLLCTVTVEANPVRSLVRTTSIGSRKPWRRR